MATTVFVKLRDGRRLSVGKADSRPAAEKVRQDVESWIMRGVTLTISNEQGKVEDITPTGVVGFDVCEELS
jgi:hypothetical protein